MNDVLFYVLLLLALPTLGFILNSFVTLSRVVKQRIHRRFPFTEQLSFRSK
ncbi:MULTISPECIES: hypothetical protein [unclassified Exiguobacterium]|uniref:hypothetical protein n=1 Tax=unclassified Exiguobacterium TaxID=2644629 RepID=UPI001BEB34DB|nr:MULTISPECIES: hypothetical protein [unclassified Exiguobacterium]